LTLLTLSAFAADCSKTSTGLHPFNAPFFRSYKGSPTGLYPGASDLRPIGHQIAGQSEMAQVRARIPSGSIDDTNGKIVVLSIGSAIALDTDVNPRIVVVDGSQAGWTADRIALNPLAFFGGVDLRLSAAGVTMSQVQAGWMELADANSVLPFPLDAQNLQSELKSIVQALRAHYPNLRLLYLSSSPYAGYAAGEPYAFETGFAVKGLIEAQIQGDLNLSYNAAKAPWMSWGPYLWADGTNARADGLAWSCSDFQDDGAQLSVDGANKVAGMLLDFFKGDLTTRPWFVGPPPQPPASPVLNTISNAASYAPQIGLAAIASIFGTGLADGAASAPRIPLPYGLAGTSVTIGGAPAPLYAVSPTQINLVVPPEAAGMDVGVSRNGVPSAAINIQFSMFTEGFFSLDATGTGPAAARHVNGDLVTPQNPAHRGETIAFFATGKGVQNPLILIPQVLPIVRVGGVQADIGYFSIAPGIPGLDQVNIVIPMSAPAGDRVPVQMQIGGTPSNQVTLAIAL